MRQARRICWRASSIAAPRTRSAADIADELDGRGISLTITVTRHLFSIVGTCLVEDFEAILALLGDILMAPTVPGVRARDAERRGHHRHPSGRRQPGCPRGRAVDGDVVRGRHPYGRRVKGSIAAVEAATRERLIATARERFAPSELTAVVVGDVESAARARGGRPRLRRLARALACAGSAAARAARYRRAAASSSR